MKFLRFLCNLLMFIAITFGLSCIQVGLFDISAAQSSDVNAIHISSGDDSEIGYLDSYTFWIDDIKTNYTQDAKYRVRNWASWGWWKTGMAWADYVVDGTLATFKPILVPIAQVNATMIYYDKCINDFNSELVRAYNSEEEINNALYELYVIYSEYAYTGKDVYTVDLDNSGDSVLISEYEYSGSEEGGDKVAYARWVRNNKVLYNNDWKLNKYNCGTYDKYFTKFITTSESGERHIKAAVIVLYYQQYVSLIIALIFVIKFPINFLQGKYTGDDMGVKKVKKKRE